MTLKWYRVQSDGTTTFLHEGKDLEDGPGLRPMQEAVGGFIERIPSTYLSKAPSVFFEIGDEAFFGKVVEIWCNEESKLNLYSALSSEEAMANIEQNQNPLSSIMLPFDMILGDAVAVLRNVEEAESGCRECENVGEDHPDWMKGLCEACYASWAEGWNISKSQTPSD